MNRVFFNANAGDKAGEMISGEPGGRAFPSFGEKACGVSFNPSNDPVVDEIKKKSAELVDLIHGLRSGVTGEAARYYSKAISHIEDGQMNAVKGRTWQH